MPSCCNTFGVMDLKNLACILKDLTSKICQQLKLEPQKAEQFVNLDKTVNTFHKICIPTDDGFEFIALDEIIRMHGCGNHCEIFLTDGKQAFSPRNLKEFDELLSPMNFLRVHKSHLINESFIQSYHAGEPGRLIMTDGKEVEVSRQHKDMFLEQIINHKHEA